ncbi:MAG TPA: hypothetical protein VMW58_02490 [Anaerolineae bacterium]|nr:hypothetical protein [Anaerolineae bacterium]
MARDFVKIKPLLPGAFRPDRFMEAFRKESRALADRTKREFQKTHRTWQEQNPTWRVEVRVDFTEIRWQVDTSHLIYYFLNNGTDVRYAAMTPGFQPKTKVRYIGSFPGQGGFSYLRFNPPPGPAGIDGRFWDEEIAKKMKPIALERYGKAMKSGAKGSGHSYG